MCRIGRKTKGRICDTSRLLNRNRKGQIRKNKSIVEPNCTRTPTQAAASNPDQTNTKTATPRLLLLVEGESDLKLCLLFCFGLSRDH